MSFKEVMNLRKEGNLEEAYKVAYEDLSNSLNSSTDSVKTEEVTWAERAMSWVYYDYLKKSVIEKNPQAFLKTLEKVVELDLGESETMFYDQAIWQVGSIIFQLHGKQSSDFTTIGKIFDGIKKFHFTKPSEGYSFLYKSFHKGYKKWHRYLEFADWWSLENFSNSDYKNEQLPNGKTIMPLIERAYIAYAKNLLRYFDHNGDESQNYESELSELDIHEIITSANKGYSPPTVEVSKEKIESFLKRLESVIEKYPQFKYLPYFKAKLLLLLDDEKNSLNALIPFAREKQNEYWVWEVMADAFPDNDDRKLACYCKALSTNSSEDFLVKTRKKLAEVLIGRQAFDEAKTEIKKVIATRSENDWRISQDIQNWTSSNWFQEAKDLEDNHRLYKKHVETAEKLLVKDIPEVTVAVEFVNVNKKMLNFIEDKENLGFFKYAGHLDQVSIGDILKVRLNKKETDGYHKVISARKVNDIEVPNVIKNFEGVFNNIPNKIFGFVDDIFVNPNLVQNAGLTSGKSVTGKAIISFDKKKNKWGWKAFDIRVGSYL